MTWRSIIGIVFSILVLAACFIAGRENADLLGRQLRFWTNASGHSLGFSVGEALLGCLALGAALVALAWAARSTGSSAQRAEERRSDRRARGLSDRLAGGLAAAAAGRDAEALAELEAVLGQDPEQPLALRAAADLLRRLGRPAEALELRQRLGSQRPDDHDLLAGLAGDHRARGDLAMAGAALEQLLARKPADGTRIARQLVEVRIEQGDIGGALTAHAAWARLQGEAPAREVELERTALETRQAAREAREGRVREALVALKKVLRQHPDYAPASLALAHAHLLDGDEEAAVEAWISGYEASNEGAILVAAEEHFLGSLAEDEDAIERADSALATMKRFVACSGERPQAIAFLGKLQTRFEMLEDAARTLDSVRASFPDNPTFTYYAARIAEKRGRHQVAAQWYRGILKALDILRPTHRCTACETEAASWTDRCTSCRRWGTVSLDSGIKPLSQPLPAAHPVYAVRGEASELDEASSSEEDEQGA